MTATTPADPNEHDDMTMQHDEQLEPTGTSQPEDAATDKAQDGPGDIETDPADDASVRLLGADELHAVVSKWREIQAEFVDQPKRAMQEADELVTALMDRLAQTFAEQREHLEARWSDAENVSTEELRQGLQRYRSFFERLLAA